MRPRFDDLSLAALDAAAAAGGSPRDWGGLLAADDLPLAFAVLDVSLAMLTERVERLERFRRTGGFAPLHVVGPPDHVHREGGE